MTAPIGPQAIRKATQRIRFLRDSPHIAIHSTGCKPGPSAKATSCGPKCMHCSIMPATAPLTPCSLSCQCACWYLRALPIACWHSCSSVAVSSEVGLAAAVPSWCCDARVWPSIRGCAFALWCNGLATRAHTRGFPTCISRGKTQGRHGHYLCPLQPAHRRHTVTTPPALPTTSHRTLWCGTEAHVWPSSMNAVPALLNKTLSACALGHQLCGSQNVV